MIYFCSYSIDDFQKLVSTPLNDHENSVLIYFPPTYIAYMNYDMGIVGFEITSTGMLWVFDRIE